MTAVSSKGSRVVLGDGEHRVRFSTEALIEIEDLFDGFGAMLGGFANKPNKTIVAVLEVAEIDGERWDVDRIATALTGSKRLNVARELQGLLFAEMGYTEDSITDEQREKAKALMDAGVDPTKPETWTPAKLSEVVNGSTGRAS